ncbi:hypothetical protein PHYSODRAFT_295568 [Phytophthora sojae]|uniref:Endonuclease/exonuclease/phosphatase domain-containing protein n=1 Tax=Phytophthora sojae (strain P6497) TaxID=1094619 RepID=G4YSG7_PHYSP|nr:hypothetical protein PHYSODRAFT_295568 [Phytophthora sojae]EGZ22983.1 hypothetical protein PHYSODRAFT_295568 [Phytophthora sojae]|eukprot:XP_009518271.1 hypothetical protein PHYSODRAFT_295568 [Phytophthora sojae]
MPGLTLIGNKRAGILMDSERWQGRLIKQDTKLSPSGRSISVTVRLGRRAELVLAATYLPDTPQANIMTTKQERDWIDTRIELAQQRQQIIIVGGDFNAYPDGGLDRQGPGAQAAGARRQSEYFKQWTEVNGLVSTFKQRHPRTPRFTYSNGGTYTALDNIYINSQHAHQVEQSGIWLYSVNRGDHVGTPFVSLALSQLQETRRHLKGVRSIRHVDTKKKTPEEMMEYTQTLSDMLATGKLSLMDSINVANSSEEAITTWLHESIENVYKCIYSAAKHLWGEKSQARKVIDRAVSKKRTARCHDQFNCEAAWSSWRILCSKLASHRRYPLLRLIESSPPQQPRHSTPHYMYRHIESTL